MDESTEKRVRVLHPGAIPLLAVWMISVLFQGGCAPEPEQDRVPESVTFGRQTWMATNLADTLYRNGDPIPHAATADELWSAGEAGEGAFMRQADGTVLYNWHAFMDPRGLGPPGWRAPSNEDWSALAETLGADSAGWRLQHNDFRATLDGFRHYTGEYDGQGTYGSWWTTTVRSDDDWYVYFRGVGTDYTELYQGESSTYYGMSVRLIRDR